MKTIFYKVMILIGLLIPSLLLMGSGYPQPIVNDDIKNQINQAIISYLQDQGIENLSKYNIKNDDQISSTKVNLIFQQLYFDYEKAKETTNFNELYSLILVQNPVTYTCVIEGTYGTQSADIQINNNKIDVRSYNSNGDNYILAYNKLLKEFGGKSLGAYIIPSNAEILVMKDEDKILFQPLGMEMNDGGWVTDVNSIPVLSGDGFYKMIMPVINSTYSITNLDELKNLPLGGRNTKANYISTSLQITLIIVGVCLFLFAGAILTKGVVLKHLNHKR